MIFVQNVKVASATAGHLPPQSIAAAGTGAPAASGYVAGTALLGRSLAAFVQTGAGTFTSAAFKLSEATDASGTGVADTTGGTIATISAANTASQAELVGITIDPAKFYGIRCAVTGGTSVIAGGQLRLLDPNYSA